jgi:hypothetical protein
LRADQLKKAITVPIFADGIFDWNEAVVRVAVLIAIPLAIAAVGFAIYLLSGGRKQ